LVTEFLVGHVHGTDKHILASGSRAHCIVERKVDVLVLILQSPEVNEPQLSSIHQGSTNFGH
jgi:hypothetical protein